MARRRGHWLTIGLTDASGNRFGLGAKIVVVRPTAPPLQRTVHTDGSYLSASDPRVHVGLGEAAQVDRIEVTWPDGAREYWPGPAVDRIIQLTRGSGTAR